MAPNLVQSFASIRLASFSVFSRFCFNRRAAESNAPLRTRAILERGSSSFVGGAITLLFLFFFFFFFFARFNFLNIPDHTDPTILFTNGNCLWSSKASITVIVCCCWCETKRRERQRKINTFDRRRRLVQISHSVMQQAQHILLSRRGWNHTYNSKFSITIFLALISSTKSTPLANRVHVACEWTKLELCETETLKRFSMLLCNSGEGVSSYFFAFLSTYTFIFTQKKKNDITAQNLKLSLSLSHYIKRIERIHLN